MYIYIYVGMFNVWMDEIGRMYRPLGGGLHLVLLVLHGCSVLYHHHGLVVLTAVRIGFLLWQF